MSLFLIFIDVSYDVVSPTMLKAFLDSITIGRLGALGYPYADKNLLRLALDLFILIYAYDNPFDEDSSMLDESAATKSTNAFVSAISDTESFYPAPNLPIIMTFREYVLTRSLFGGKKMFY